MPTMFGKRTLVPDSTEAPTRAASTATPGRTTLVQQLAQPAAAGATPRGEQVHAAAEHGLSGAAQELPHLDRIQAAFGRHDVTGVRAHVGGPAAEGAAAMAATAYASGGQVAFAGTPDLHTAAHEAAHVVQQSGGVQLKGGVGEAGDAYERHADAVADRVMSDESAEALLDPHAGPAAAPGAGQVQHRLVQRRDQNGPYTGNRPEPSSSTGAGYAIRSSANRVLHVGDGVEYRIEQPLTTSGQLGVRWQIINDPATAASAGLPATLDGPTDQTRWGGITARVVGVHAIKAWGSVDGQVAEVTYQQQVVASGGASVRVPDNATASSLATMSDFIALVRRIETAYSGRPWQDVVSRIRKEYYPGAGGPYSGIKASFTRDDLIDEQEEMPGLEVPPVAMADVAAIRHHQVVTTTAGESVDIGHILTGVDSFNFPGVAGIFATQGTEGPAAATWSGDVGSALVNWASNTPVSDTSAATKLRFYDSYASRSDMLGDVDALAVAHGPNLNLPAGAPLSQRLEAFYQTQAATATGQNQRFHNFCRASQFTLANNRLDAAAGLRIRDQIVRFSRGYNVTGSALDGIIMANGGGIENTTMGRIETQVGWFADHFIERLNAGLAAEGVP
jgi:hypothetical protein